ncbi:MAG: HAD hydrolase family protein, partial [Nitrospirota bacterium]|nr:HAD hydrolase family protein [Nitrospirota bacterium]
MKYVVFSDIDGTLVDFNTYSMEQSIEAAKILHDRDIPLVLCSSKTRTEIELYRDKIGCRDPFIVENGGGIFIPVGYFSHPLKTTVSRDGYDVVELGIPYNRLRTMLEDIRRETGYPIKGMGDMSLEEVCRYTNLPPHEAELARCREFDEPFVIEGVHPDMSVLWQSASEMGVSITRGGRFFHLLGRNDKGLAVKKLSA